MFVYILQSLRDNKYYTGCTQNIEERLKRHNLGLVKSTKSRRPFKLVYEELLENYGAARRRETEIKRMKGGIQFKSLLRMRE